MELAAYANAERRRPFAVLDRGHDSDVRLLRLEAPAAHALAIVFFGDTGPPPILQAVREDGLEPEHQALRSRLNLPDGDTAGGDDPPTRLRT